MCTFPLINVQLKTIPNFQSLIRYLTIYENTVSVKLSVSKSKIKLLKKREKIFHKNKVNH